MFGHVEQLGQVGPYGAKWGKWEQVEQVGQVGEVRQVRQMGPHGANSKNKHRCRSNLFLFFPSTRCKQETDSKEECCDGCLLHMNAVWCAA